MANDSAPDTADFRVLTDAAPLKPDAPLLEPGTGLDFRVLTDAAPLKRRPLERNWQQCVQFPRSHGRGSVEARSPGFGEIQTGRISAFSRTRLR